MQNRDRIRISSYSLSSSSFQYRVLACIFKNPQNQIQIQAVIDLVLRPTSSGRERGPSGAYILLCVQLLGPPNGVQVP